LSQMLHFLTLPETGPQLKHAPERRMPTPYPPTMLERGCLRRPRGPPSLPLGCMF